jgi:hypothetical protein
MDEWNWWPLREALAWVVSRDDEFTREMREETFAGDCRLCNLEDSNLFLSTRLENDMLEAGCFTKQTREMLVRGEERVEIEEYSLTPNYQGRFQRLAEDYEAARQVRLRDRPSIPLSLYEFLLGRLREAARRLARLAADGKIEMRDALDTIPAAQAGTLGIVGKLDELLPDGQMNDASGRERTDITVNREKLLNWFLKVRGDAIHPVAKKPGPDAKKPAVLSAYRELFPDGLPEGLSVQECRRKLREFMKRKGITPPF